MNRPITAHRRNMSNSRAMRRLIVDVIRGRDSAARSNDFEDPGEDGGGGGGLCVDFAATLTGRLQWGALNPFACFTIVNGDALGAPRTNKGDSHPQRFNHKAPSVVSAHDSLMASAIGISTSTNRQLL